MMDNIRNEIIQGLLCDGWGRGAGYISPLVCVIYACFIYSFGCVRSLFLQVINIMASLWTYFQPKVALILNVSVLLGGDHSSAGLPIIVTDMQFENYTK